MTTPTKGGAVLAFALILGSATHVRAETENPQVADAAAKPKIEEVIVTASPLPRDANTLATIAGEVNRDQILRSGGANLADALSDIPGVTGSGFASGASRPVIRGFDANRVRILENGIGSFDVSDVGPDHGVPIDPLSTQKIEVVRGAATLRYGSQALGGVVNAINNRVPLTLPDKPVSGELSGTYGTNGNVGQGSAMVDARVGQFAFHADGFLRHTDNYGTPLGTQNNSFFRGDGGAFGGSYFADDNRIGAAIIHYDAKYGIPSDTTFIDMKQTKGLVRSSFALDAGALHTLTVDGGYADYVHREIDPNGYAVLSTFRDKEWDSRVEALFGAIGPFSQSALGAQIQHKDFSALGEGADYLLPTTTKTAAAFAFTEAPLTQGLRLDLGTRAEHVTAGGTPSSGLATSRSFTPVSGSVGLVWDASKSTTLGLTASSAARAPGQTELFARGAHDGPGTFETGSATLGLERANSLEATARLHLKGFAFEGSAWAAKFNNYIYGRLTGRTCDDTGFCAADNTQALRELNYEQRDATFRGLEGKATIGLTETKAGSLSADIIADMVRATLAGGENVPRIPPYHVGGGLTWEGDVIDGGFMVKYAGAQTKVAIAETPTAGFVSVDARVALHPWATQRGIELVLVGHNLTNTVQRNAVSLNKDDVVMQGRDVRLILNARF